MRLFLWPKSCVIARTLLLKVFSTVVVKFFYESSIINNLPASNLEFPLKFLRIIMFLRKVPFLFTQNWLLFFIINLILFGPKSWLRNSFDWIDFDRFQVYSNPAFFLSSAVWQKEWQCSSFEKWKLLYFDKKN